MRTRRSPSEIPPKKSRSVENLPPLIRAVFEDAIMPSLKEEYGAVTEPVWDLEYGILNLRETLQKYIDLLCPDAKYTVVASSTKDLVYECVCPLSTYSVEHSPRVCLRRLVCASLLGASFFS